MNSRIVRYTIIIIGVILIINTVKTTGDLWLAGGRVDRRAEEISRMEKENEAIKQKIAEVESPEYLEKAAREKLNMAKPGEEVLILPKNSAATVSAEVISTKPNWQKWREIIF